MIVWDHWHIEASSVCALKCPRCPRAEVADTLLNKQLTLDFFQTQIGAAAIRSIKKITFCGNDGDPIYCRDFLLICEWVKEVNPTLQIVIVTNGSYKSGTWWASLGTILNEHDEVHWSIDGWDSSSNSKYRVNSDWHSIQEGINAFFNTNTKTYRVWDAIAFKFNENYIMEMQSIATTHEFDLFQLTKSTKFGSKYPASYPDDILEPDDTTLVARGYRFERALTPLSDKVRPGAELKQVFLHRAEQLKRTNLAGICLIGNKGVFLNSRGELYPCCWTANRYHHNHAWHELANARFNLHNRTFLEIQQDPFWTTDFLEFSSHECKTKCTPDKLSDTSHTTEW